MAFNYPIEQGTASTAKLYRGTRRHQRHIPEETYMPLKQEAQLLQRARDNGDAVAFLQYLQSDAARDTIRSMGYGVP